MKINKILASILCGACCTTLLNADTLVLRDKSAIEGTFVGGTTKYINFVSSSGKTMQVPVSQVMWLTFSAPAAAVAAAPTRV